MSPTLCIWNERAGPKLSIHDRHLLSSQLEEQLGDIQLVATHSTEEVEPLLQSAISQDIKAVLVLGGDGTAHHLINVLMRIRAEDSSQDLPPFGVLPLGTGCDWSRGLRQPLKTPAALSWLARASSRLIDIGELHTENSQQFFLNIASCGLSGEVSNRIQSLRKKRPWSYFTLTIQSLLGFERSYLSVEVDGQKWYEGYAALVACCNGSHFGRGMRIAPSASTNDGWLEVLLAERLNYFELLRLSPSAYLGQSFGRGALKQTRGKRIQITSEQAFQYEADGEASRARTFEIRLHKHALNALLV